MGLIIQLNLNFIGLVYFFLKSLYFLFQIKNTNIKICLRNITDKFINTQIDLNVYRLEII